MRVKVIHITDHAMLRWSQRVSKTGTTFDIKDAIQKSKVIKKNEILPYMFHRFDGSVYSVHNGVMFVMEPVSIEEFRLVTVVAEFMMGFQPLKKISKENQFLQKKQRLKEKQEKKNDRKPKRSPRNRAETRSVYVQSAISGLSNLAPEGDDDI